MFALMKDRLADLDEMLRGDTSPKEVWADISEEKRMRRMISRELEISSNGLYSVNQESVTAEEKETDIRLCSNVSGHEAVIELKLGEKWSGKELRDTIQKQLVAKYLAPEKRRSGCLLVTYAGGERWKHPESGKHIGLEELKSLLEEEARRVEASSMETVYLAVHILDLRPRLAKPQ